MAWSKTVTKEMTEWQNRRQAACTVCGAPLFGVPHAKRLRKVMLCMEHAEFDLICNAITRAGKRCSRGLIIGKDYCNVHQKMENVRNWVTDVPDDEDRCIRCDIFGNRCLNSKHTGHFCIRHYASLIPEEFEDEFAREYLPPVIDSPMDIVKFVEVVISRKEKRKKRKRLPKTDYYNYINSAEWRKVAKAARKRAGYRCQLCNHNGKLHVHHRTYERLGNELPEDLTVLCETCHENFHDVRGKPGNYVQNQDAPRRKSI